MEVIVRNGVMPAEEQAYYENYISEKYPRLKIRRLFLTIDGDMENVYNYGLKLTTIGATDPEIYADAWLLWDDEYLYMYAQVFDYEIYSEEKANSIEKQWYVDSFEIFMDGDKIILKKYRPACIFCNSLTECIDFETYTVCKNCIEKLNNIKDTAK